MMRTAKETEAEVTMEPLSELVAIGSRKLYLHTWKPLVQEPRAVVVVYHGFLAHGRYPTVRFAAEQLVQAGFVALAADLPGHGASPGVRGYLSSPDEVLGCGLDVARYARSKYENRNLFLLGSSMGGTIALSVALQLQDDAAARLAGVVLLAPMLKLSVSSVAQYLLRGLSSLAPTWEVVPSSSTSLEKQYRDPAKRKECEDDEFRNTSGRIRVGSASTCVELAAAVQESFSGVSCPLLVMVADEDVVVDNQGAMALMANSASQDKQLKRYPALHGLLCEPRPLLDEIQADLIHWMEERA